MRGVACCCSYQYPIASSTAINPNPNRNDTLPARAVSVSTAAPVVADDLRRRRLILLRHAESAAPDRRFLKDHDRPLSKAGRGDAIAISRKLQQMDWVPELILSRCMGHNRGWEEAASMLSGVSVELKTCNAALLEASGKSWSEAFASTGLGGWTLHGIVKPDE